MTSSAVRILNNSHDLDEEYKRKLLPAIYIAQHTTTPCGILLGRSFTSFTGLEATNVAQNRNLFGTVQ